MKAAGVFARTLRTTLLLCWFSLVVETLGLTIYAVYRAWRFCSEIHCLLGAPLVALAMCSASLSVVGIYFGWKIWMSAP